MIRYALPIATCFIVFINPSAHAAIIAFTSFEDPAAVPGRYKDTGNPSVDHDLVNNPGQPLVDFTATGNELGFNADYLNTRNGTGLTEGTGDLVGVTNFDNLTGPFPDGNNAYQISDPDGTMRVTTDAVSLVGFTNTTVSIDLFVAFTGYEPDDAIRIYATGDGGEVDLLNTTGSDINDLNIEGRFITYTGNLNGFTVASLVFQFEADSDNEQIFVDNIRFEGEAVPEPTSLALLGIVGLGGIVGQRIRNRRSTQRNFAV